jgi:hypothetical protein
MQIQTFNDQSSFQTRYLDGMGRFYKCPRQVNEKNKHFYMRLKAIETHSADVQRWAKEAADEGEEI